MPRRSYDYENDVAYEVWRSGGNPDLVGEDVESSYWDGDSVDQAISDEMNRQRPQEPDPDYSNGYNE